MADWFEIMSLGIPTVFKRQQCVNPSDTVPLNLAKYFFRPSGAKVLPPRPPPAKTGPGRPPPPQTDNSQHRPSNSGFSQIVTSKQQQPQWQQQNRRASKKGPALPPRPNPGHRLYNKYTVRFYLN